VLIIGMYRLFLLMLLIVQIIKVLGEGGFSFVYLAQDEHSGVCSDTVLDEVGMLKSSALLL
jgi:hypothetical protein